MAPLPYSVRSLKLRQKDYGSAIPAYCTECGRDRYLHIQTARYWVTFLKIPLLPKRASWKLVCPGCEQSTNLTKEEYKHARKVRNQLRRLEEGVISSAEFETTLQRFHTQTELLELKPSTSTLRNEPDILSFPPDRSE